LRQSFTFGQRWPNVKDWRKAWPQQWQETRDRIKLALQAAATVRAADWASLETN
jgi:hypothetical protein